MTINFKLRIPTSEIFSNKEMKTIIGFINRNYPELPEQHYQENWTEFQSVVLDSEGIRYLNSPEDRIGSTRCMPKNLLGIWDEKDVWLGADQGLPKTPKNYEYSAVGDKEADKWRVGRLEFISHTAAVILHDDGTQLLLNLHARNLKLRKRDVKAKLKELLERKFSSKENTVFTRFQILMLAPQSEVSDWASAFGELVEEEVVKLEAHGTLGEKYILAKQ